MPRELLNLPTQNSFASTLSELSGVRPNWFGVPPHMTSSAAGVGVVSIGRNEGERLKRCLESVKNAADCIVYVDSGSTDGSLELARELAVVVVELDLKTPFTAARAR